MRYIIYVKDAHLCRTLSFKEFLRASIVIPTPFLSTALILSLGAEPSIIFHNPSCMDMSALLGGGLTGSMTLEQCALTAQQGADGCLGEKDNN